MVSLLGCIGAWVLRNLVDEGVNVVATDLATDPAVLPRLDDPQQLGLELGGDRVRAADQEQVVGHAIRILRGGALEPRLLDLGRLLHLRVVVRKYPHPPHGSGHDLHRFGVRWYLENDGRRCSVDPDVR